MSIEISWIIVGYFLLILSNIIATFTLIILRKNEEWSWLGYGLFVIIWMDFLFIGNDHYHWIVFT